MRGLEQVEGIALRCPRPGGRNEREKDTRLVIRFPAPDAALGAGGRRSAAIPTWGVGAAKTVEVGYRGKSLYGNGVQNEMLPSKQVDDMSCWQVSAEALHPPTYELTKTKKL